MHSQGDGIVVNVAVVVGSLRRESINRKLALALKKLAAPQGLDLELVALDDLPQYNEDLWANPPEAVTRLKRQIEAADAVLFITPEYNRAIPGLLKNAVDWASRPWGKNSWSGKPAAIAGATAGKIGTAVAQAQLRGTLVVLDMALMGQPEAYVQLAPDTIDPAYNVTDEAVRRFLAGFLAAFVDWIGKVAGIVPEPGQPDAAQVIEEAA
jgi:chromate reductase